MQTFTTAVTGEPEVVFSYCVTQSGVLPGNTDNNHLTTRLPSPSIQKLSVSQTKDQARTVGAMDNKGPAHGWVIAGGMAFSLKTRATERLFSAPQNTEYRLALGDQRGKGVWYFRLACHSMNLGLLEDLETQKWALCALTRLPSLLGYSVGADVSSRTASVAFILFSY